MPRIFLVELVILEGLNITSVLLAAGMSQRMNGVNKLLVNINGKPLIRRVAETYLKSLAKNLVIVTGFEESQVRNALVGLPVKFVHNAEYKEGLSSSISAGIKAASFNTEGVLIALGDMPLILENTVNTIVENFQQSNRQFVFRPLFRGAQGHPVLWPKVYFSELLGLTGDQGAQSLLDRFPTRLKLIEVDDSGILQDFDKFQDIKKLKI